MRVYNHFGNEHVYKQTETKPGIPYQMDAKREQDCLYSFPLCLKVLGRTLRFSYFVIITYEVL